MSTDIEKMLLKRFDTIKQYIDQFNSDHKELKQIEYNYDETNYNVKTNLFKNTSDDIIINQLKIILIDYFIDFNIDNRCIIKFFFQENLGQQSEWNDYFLHHCLTTNYFDIEKNKIPFTQKSIDEMDKLLSILCENSDDDNDKS